MEIPHSLPEKPNYGAAYFIVYFLYFIATILAALGIIWTGPILGGIQNIILTDPLKIYFAMLGGVLLFVSLIVTAAAHILKANLDTAVFGWHTMNMMRLNKDVQ